MVSSRTIVNIMNVTILKAESTVNSGGSDHVCKCLKQIDLLLLIYRFIRYVCFNLFRSAQWQYFIMLEAMRRCCPTSNHQEQGIPQISSCDKAIELPDEEDIEDKDSDDLCYDNSWIEVDGGFYDDSSSEWEIIHNNSWYVGEDNNDISSLSSRTEENIVFYLESSDDGKENDHENIYNVQRLAAKDPLEPFFEQSEIDWDAPLCDQSDEEEMEEELFHQYEEIYIDDDCFALVASCQNEASFCTDEDFHKLASDVSSNGSVPICSSVFTSDGILEDVDDVLPIDDEEVLAAITGVSKKHPT